MITYSLRLALNAMIYPSLGILITFEFTRVCTADEAAAC
jgi:hypothetical protein